MNHLRSAITVNYDPVANPAEADCVQVHSFGTGYVNRVLATKALELANDRSAIMADRNAIVELNSLNFPIGISVAGDIGNGITADRPGTWGALLEMRRIMAAHGWERPLLIGHARHIGRITMQAVKLGMDPIVPTGLPHGLDKNSDQMWTRRLIFWIPYEFAATLKLKLDDQL